MQTLSQLITKEQTHLSKILDTVQTCREEKAILLVWSQDKYYFNFYELLKLDRAISCRIILLKYRFLECLLFFSFFGFPFLFLFFYFLRPDPPPATRHPLPATRHPRPATRHPRKVLPINEVFPKGGKLEIRDKRIRFYSVSE